MKIPKPFKLSATEKEEQKAFFQHVRLKAAIDFKYKNIFAIPNGAHLYRGAAGYFSLAQQGVSKGVPDIFVAQTSIYQGAVKAGLFIELKRKDKYNVSEEQIDWCKRLIDAGYEAQIIYGSEAAISLLDEYMRKAGPLTIS